MSVFNHVMLTATALALWVMAITGVRAARSMSDHHDLARAEQVDTHNEGTVGSFASEDETRRVEEIARPDRTPTEQRHLDAAPLKEQRQGEGV